MYHCATSVVLLEFQSLQMERALHCNFVVAIIESEDGNIAAVDCVDC